MIFIDGGETNDGKLPQISAATRAEEKRVKEMGQHILHGQNGQYFVRLGWDGIYQTFFIQVTDTHPSSPEEDTEDREPLLWLGQITQPSITTLEPILEAAAPYVVIPEELQDQLRLEQAQDLMRERSTEAPSRLDLFYEYQLLAGAQELFIEKNYDEALAILEKVLGRNPEAVAAVALKAGIESELGQQAGEQKEEHIQRSVELYRQAIELAYAQGYTQITPRLRTGLGRAYAEANQIKEALAEYDHALHDIARGTALDATDEALALEAKADLLLYYKHDPIGAIPYYEQALHLAPENEVIRYNLGLTRLAKRQRDEAERDER